MYSLNNFDIWGTYLILWKVIAAKWKLKENWYMQANFPEKEEYFYQ